MKLRPGLALLASCALAACADKPRQQERIPFRIDLLPPAVIEYHSAGDYSEALRNKIQGNLIHVPGEFPATTEAVFSLRLLASGDIQEIKVEKSSGYRNVDEACLKAIQSSTPLPILNRRTSGVDASTLRLVIRPFDRQYKQAAAAEKLFTYESQIFGAMPFVKSPKLITGLPPYYPVVARRKEVCGTVRLALLISSSGEVLEQRVLDSRPPNLFDQSVLDVIPSLKFQPHLVQQQAVRFQTIREYTFKISDEQGDYCPSEPVSEVSIVFSNR